MRSPEPRRLVTCREFRGNPRSYLARLRIKAQFALLRSCVAEHDRKNWLFVGSQQAGERAAVVMSLIESAKLNGHDPWAYLKDVFDRLPTLKQRDLAQLLPHNWRPANAAAAAAPNTALADIAA